MSFAIDLKGRVDLVNRYAQDMRKGTEQFIQLLRERVLHEEAYANGLERIGSHTYVVASQGTLAEAVTALKTDSLNKAAQARIFAEIVTNDLAEPLVQLLRSQNAAIKTCYAEGKRLQEELDALSGKHSQAYSRYWQACHDTEELTVLLDTEPQTDRRSKATHKLVQLKKEVDDGFHLYQTSIDAYNSAKTRHDVVTAGILDTYQQQEETRLEAMKDTLRKFVIYETSSLRNMQYDVDQLARVSVI